jgi:cell division protein FtsB
MVDRLKRRGRRKSYLDSPWVVLGLGIIAVSMTYYALSSFLRQRSVQDEQSLLNQEIEERTAAIVELKQQIDRVNSGEGLELEVRSRLNLQKPGERVLIIVDEEDDDDVIETQESEGFWRRIIPWL